MILVSMWATFDLSFSFPKVAGLLYGVAVFYATVAAVQGSARRLWLAVAFQIGLGLAVATMGLLLATWSQRLPLPAGVRQLGEGAFGWLPRPGMGINPNEIAGVLLWMTPLAWVLAAVALTHARPLRQSLTETGLPRTVSLIILAGLPLLALFLSGVLLLARSRAALLGLAAGLLLAATVAAGRYRRFLFAALLVFALTGSVILLVGGSGPLLALLQLPAFSSGGSAVNSWEGRLEIWSRALYGISDFPLTGIGMGTFRRVIHILYPLFLIPPERDLGHAHNHLLQTALDLGLPGLIAYLALWFALAAAAWRAWRQTSSLWLRALVTGLAASLLAYFVYGMLDAVALGARPGFIFWILVGLAVSVYRQSAGNDGDAVANKRQTPNGT
jgi:putative inorganic carbon (HCO3(-)) transporter